MAFLSPIYRTVFYRFVDLIPIYPKCFSGAILKYLGATQPGTQPSTHESDADSADEHSPGMIIIVVCSAAL